MNKLGLLVYTVILLGFFGVIGYGVFITQSATPLWALLLTPTWKKECKCSEEDADEK